MLSYNDTMEIPSPEQSRAEASLLLYILRFNYEQKI